MRGVDFKLTGDVDIIMAFRVISYFDCIQALGRGTRDFTKSSSGTIMIEKDKDLPIEAKDLLKYFKD
jgi:hypothetical protein